MKTDVLIIGSEPAGLATALNLPTQGHSPYFAHKAPLGVAYAAGYMTVVFSEDSKDVPAVPVC